jgi:pilus assembly protein CpaB
MLFAALAVAVATGTAFVSWRIVKSYEQRLNAEASQTSEIEVAVAVKDLRPGHVIVDSDIGLSKRVIAGSKEGIYTDVSRVLGQVVGDRILNGEIIRTERLVVGGAKLHVNELLDPGARAVTVRASRASAVGGLLKPGNYVDVIVTIKPENEALAAEWVTETILQGVRVLAVGDDVNFTPEEEADDKKNKQQTPRETWITLEVEPAEAEHLALATARGTLHLSLRGRDDFELLDPGSPLVTNALVGLPEPVASAQAERLARKQATVAPRSSAQAAPITPAAPPPAPGASGHTVEQIRGDELSTEVFDDQGNRVAPVKSGRR